MGEVRLYLLYGDPMVSVLYSRLSDPGSSAGRGHGVVFLGKTRDSHSASLHPGFQMSTGEFNAGSNPTLQWTWIPSKEGVEILLVTSYYWNGDKLQSDEPLGTHALFTLCYRNKANYSTEKDNNFAISTKRSLFDGKQLSGSEGLVLLLSQYNLLNTSLRLSYYGQCPSLDKNILKTLHGN